MAKKISSMSEATEIKSGDVSIIVQDGETKKFNLDLLPSKSQIDNYKANVETQLTTYEQEITDIKNQYDKELYTPEISVTNTSIVKTGQGDTLDYSESVEDGVVKSAILSGNTLVNLIKNGYIPTSSTNKEYATASIVPLDGSKEYTLMLNKNLVQINVRFWYTDGSWGDDYEFSSRVTSGYIKNKIQIDRANATGKTLENIQIYSVDANEEITNIMLLEGDYTNVDVPYFEGMQSVKMPVLTTTGKNLLNSDFELGWIDGSTGQISASALSIATTNTIKVFPSTQYSVTRHSGTRSIIAEFDCNDLYLGYVQGDTFTTKSNTSSIRIFIQNTTDTDGHLLCLGSNNNEVYEPYKSNILTVNEEVELRGIGDIKDELNLMTGELVQRFHKTTIDENYSWTFDGENNGYLQFGTALTVKGNVEGELKGASNGLPYGTLSGEGNQEQVLVFEHEAWITQLRIMINPSRLETPDVEGFIKYITNNPFELIYAKQPTIKTVVLNPSGTLASETPYMWKDGSIQLSSDGLVPCLDYAITTSRVGVIENNMSETITNEKRIHSLEVILAQSTIASAADAVSLQSDLESTTMSTDGANLETENTQDDFLYEMILLLIENNAYDESLFDKVCMFYLYGKLSDEQFTNIYNLLYPVNQEEE